MPESARFCPHCGYQSETQPVACPQCGTAINPDTSLCPNCGSAAPGIGVQEPRFAVAEQQKVEYAGFWVRVGAWVVDILVLSIIQIVLSLIGLSFVALFVGLPYGVLFIGLKGQTPGKMALGIQIVDQRGNIPGIGRAALREIVGKFVSGIFILLGFLWVGWDRRKRGWHDHMAGTFAVRNRRVRA